MKTYSLPTDIVFTRKFYPGWASLVEKLTLRNLKSSDVHRILGLTYRQLKDWEERGILKSRSQRAEGAKAKGWRKFSIVDLIALGILKEAKRQGLPVTQPQKAMGDIFISLRFLANFGLIGLPSAGKSSLLNALTNTKVKTAAYHFTTLSPNLGVLGNKKIIADIPGLIEGASKGRGLGIRFLKHIEKVELLLHCISVETNDPVKDYEIVRNEMGSFSKKLLEKKEVILVTKNDLMEKPELERAKKMLSKRTKGKVFSTSIYDDKSLEELQEILK